MHALLRVLRLCKDINQKRSSLEEGNIPSSDEAYANSLKIAKKLMAIDPTNVQWQRDVALATQGLGDVGIRQGSLQKAERTYNESLEIRQSLATGNPNNIRGQHDLWSIHWRLALLAERGKNQRKAQTHWNEAFRVLSDIEKRGVYLSPEYRRKLETLRQKKDYA
jgi:tetratricopeptide (TPR) repeat protein